MSDKLDRAMEIVADVLEAPESERGAAIEKACAADPALRAEVQRMLEVGLGPKAQQFMEALERPPDPPNFSAEARGAAADGRFGRYRVVRLIGEGGMGSVYEADQDNPRRRVALKVIKPGMDSRRVVARFNAEREVLALMDHPNIAKVFDAGVAEGGRPFFAMELVDGVPVTQYCHEKKLPVRGRLELFISVCHGVQHAHRKGVIHRDLKPSNLLVTVVDGKPMPKVIDFGIAKAIGGRTPAGQTLLITECQELVGTPQYMSPEQAGGPTGDVDTRSDIYSLGVVLYELLTGTTPFDPKLLRESGPEEVRRLIREVEPPRPSTRLTRGQAGDAPAAARDTDAAALARTVRGELDWIVMKCLEKDRGRRYETASDLAADLERHLRHEPVLAGPPSSVYRLRKFVRRNRGPLAAAAMIVVLLVSGVAGSTIGMVRAKREAGQVAALNEFLLEMFKAARPDGEGGGRGVRVADLLDSAQKSLPQRFHNQPDAEITARMTLGGSYGQLGLLEPAIENFSIAHRLARQHLGPESERTLDAGSKMCFWITQRGGGRLSAEAEPIARDLYATARRAHGDEHRVTFFAGQVYAGALLKQGKYADSEQLYRKLDRQQRETPALNEATGATIVQHGLAHVLHRQGKLEAAEAAARESLRRHEAAGHRAPRDRGTSRRLLGLVLADVGKLEEAAAVMRDGLGAEDELGHTNGIIENISEDYLRVLVALKDFDAAAAFARRRLEQAEAHRPKDPALVVRRTERLILLLNTVGRGEQAAELRGNYQRSLEAIIQAPADGRAAILRRARALEKLGQFPQAVAEYDHCIALDPSPLDAWTARASLLAHLGDHEGYEAHCRRMLGRFGQTTDRTVADRAGKSCLLLPLPADVVGAAAGLVDRAVAGEKEHQSLRWFRVGKGLAEVRSGDYSAAVAWLSKARAHAPREQRAVALQVPVPEAVAMIDLLLAIAYHHRNERDAARAALQRARETIDRDLAVDPDFQVMTLFREARALFEPERTVPHENVAD